MRRFLIALSLLLLAVSVPAAGEKRPELPKVPKGFDEGRGRMLKELAKGVLDAGRLTVRLFDSADLNELSGFLFAHLSTAELAEVDKVLELKGDLSSQPDAGAIETFLRKRKLSARTIAKAVGRILSNRKLGAVGAGIWLYNRGYNFRIIQRAMDGKRMEAFSVRSELRRDAAAGKGADKLFQPGNWEFSLKDGRREKGGHYQGAELCETLLDLGWDAELFAHAARIKTPEMAQELRTLIQWGDPWLLWPVLEMKMSERELFDAGRDYYRRQRKKGVNSPKVLEIAVLRTQTATRWFRTSGPGVVGVYGGPWPDEKGKPAAPVKSAEDLIEADPAQFANGLTDPIREHFSVQGKDWLTLVIYDDGSARAFISGSGRAVSYGPATPLGQGDTDAWLFEGRASLKGGVGLLNLVYAAGAKGAPREMEFVHLKAIAGGALLSLDLDDGVHLRPMLLRRQRRTVGP